MTSTQAAAQKPTQSRPVARTSFFAPRSEAPTPAPAPTPVAAPAAPPATPAARPTAQKKPKPAEDHGDELGRLKRLGFSTLAECLLSIPKAYFDYTQPTAVVSPQLEEADRFLVLRAGETSLFQGKKPTEYWKGATRVEVACKDARGTSVTIVAFGNVWPWKDVQEGDVLYVHGFLTRFNGKLKLQNPHGVPPDARGKVIAQYAGKPGQVSGEALLSGVARAIHRMEDAEVLLLAQAGLRDTEFTELTGIKSAQTLLRLLHFPRDVPQGERAMALARKLSSETVVRRAAIAKTRPPVAGSAITISKQLVEELIAELPFPLTGDQRTAIDEIVHDLRSAYAMNRLLSGDVGTGKSITFMVPAAAAYAAGAEVAILVPSQLLVSQIAKELRTLFPELPVCEVVSGSKIGEGICVGTTALLSAAKKAKKKFNFTITDEQHKFSVEQKAQLATRSTNVLEATATAIPRTLALVHFGGMDVSVLRECPVKKTITTRLVGEEDLPRVDKFVAEVVARKGQVAVIYPLVDSTGESTVTEGLESVVAAGRKWERKHPGRVGILHGKLSPDEKKDVIDGMNDGRFDILVSSLVIEVGVTLPSLKAIVINHPERFGLAQLHQLRGRVARKGGQGHMFLLGTGDLEEDAVERLQLLERCSDGFALAEADMDMRGFGDVTDDSESQTGSARTLFHNARLTHKEIAETAKRLGVTL
jgi:ATP-dependent DNA helicase RecG